MKLSDNAKKSLAAVVEKFQNNDLSPIVSIARIQRSNGPEMPSRRWSFMNQVLAYIQSNGQLDCRGFQQWEKAGRKVRKGGKAVYILAPSTVTKEDKDTGEKTAQVTGFRYIPVFPFTETEGSDLQRSDYAPAQLPPLADIARRFGIKVEYTAVEDKSMLGVYKPGQDSIILATHSSEVFFHELAHAMHARTEKFLLSTYNEKEVVAEFTACVLAAMYGVDYSGNAWQYISDYSEDALTAVCKAIADVEEILEMLFQEEVES